MTENMTNELRNTITETQLDKTIMPPLFLTDSPRKNEEFLHKTFLRRGYYVDLDLLRMVWLCISLQEGKLWIDPMTQQPAEILSKVLHHCGVQDIPEEHRRYAYTNAEHELLYVGGKRNLDDFKEKLMKATEKATEETAGTTIPPKILVVDEADEVEVSPVLKDAMEKGFNSAKESTDSEDDNRTSSPEAP